MKYTKTLLLVVLALFTRATFAQETAPSAFEVKVEYVRLVNQGAGLAGSGKYLEAIRSYDKAIRLQPDNPLAHTCRGMVLLGIWRFPESKASLTRALELDRRNVAAMVWLGRCEIYELEYVRAFQWLKTALKISPDNPDGLAVLSLLLIHLDDLDRAEEVGDRALAKAPKNVFARVCRAHIKILRKEIEEAARDFASCIKLNRWSAAAYVGLAQSLSGLDRPSEAFRVLNAGLKRNAFIPAMHTMRAFVQFKLKRVGEAVRDYRKALEIDLEYPGGHGIYSFFPAAPSESRWPSGKARGHLRKAIRALEKGDTARAMEPAGEALDASPSNVLVLLVRGAAAYNLEDYETVLECARKAMALDPKAPLPHVLFLVGRSLKQEMKKLELSKEDFYARFQDLPTPRVPGVERVFTNFESLTPDGRKVVLLAVAPFAAFLPRLEKEGAYHYILPLYRHLTDVDAMSPWKGEKTFDGREYDAVRGAAGKTAVSGTETLWSATRMGPSTIAHEFAHQVHRYGLNGEQKSEITRLYKKAKKEGRCIDFYAAENEMEYFAQGYEAFISTFKRPTSSETGKNTRQDLEKKDPDFYRFLLKITRDREAAPEKR